MNSAMFMYNRFVETLISNQRDQLIVFCVYNERKGAKSGDVKRVDSMSLLTMSHYEYVIRLIDEFNYPVFHSTLPRLIDTDLKVSHFNACL